MLLNAFILALRTIRRNILRSFLTILGIVIGVASVITMVMLGDGTTAYVTQSITKLGSNMLTISPGQERRGPPTGDNSAKLFRMSDIEAIKREISGLKAVTPIGSTSLNSVYGNENYSTTIYGVTNDYFIIKDWGLQSGRIFTDGELLSGASVCIIGETVKKKLFNEQDPLNANIRLEKFSCKIIGVLNSKGAAAFGMDQDDLIVVPFKMFQRRISGRQDLSSIVLSVEESASSQRVQTDIKELLRQRRHLKEGDEDDFNIRDMKDIIATLSSTTEMLTLLLGAVAAISLVVGGIGIMNIMLVSVTERTKEIGIRLAIGALEREVMMQFLVESVVLSSIGGIIGIILGIGITVLVTNVYDIPFIFNQNIVIISFFFSTIVGVVFGYFPARKAAKMNPIDALRHE
ncbi:MAG: ABC transporter permease [Arcobacteraceae bacterium]|nr:ABC transporter permease [Arcobacteraceae bacterium]